MEAAYMTFTNEDLIKRFHVTCEAGEIVEVTQIGSRDVLALMRFQGVQHLYLDEPLDAYFVGTHGSDTNSGCEWFAIDELEEAKEAFNFRQANNPFRAYRGTIAHEIGSREITLTPAI
jgi:hypothetical protein